MRPGWSSCSQTSGGDFTRVRLAVFMLRGFARAGRGPARLLQLGESARSAGGEGFGGRCRSWSRLAVPERELRRLLGHGCPQGALRGLAQAGRVDPDELV